MLAKQSIHQTDHNGQHHKAEQFTAAFLPTPQDEQLNTDNDKVNFVLSKIAEYQARVEKLEQELYSAKVLLAGHKTWAAELCRKLDGAE